MEKANKFVAIPAINCSTKECAEVRLRAAHALGARWVHIDVTDGVFSTGVTWNDAETFAHTGMNVEVHFMVKNPERVIERWLTAGVKRVIVHVESLMSRNEDAFFEMYRLCDAHGAMLMLSMGPDTSVEEFFPYLETVKGFQFLAVAPGFSGQLFDERTIEKIKTLRNKMPDAFIEVDGGVNADVASHVRLAGANAVSSASFIWGSEDPAAALASLQNA